MFEQEIERYERVRKDYEARIKAKMSPTDYMDWHEVLFSTHSCGIEGNSFTVDDTRILKEQGLAMVPVGHSLLECTEMADHFRAFRYVTTHLDVPFDEHIMKMRAHDFFEDIVRNKLNAGHVSVGFNYTYGARAEGKPEMLKEECDKAGISISVHDAVTVEGHVVSSTLIREMIATGNMELTAKFLGRPYSFSGTVSHGKRLGSKMGIPTINIPAPDRQMLPPNGVYFSRIDIAGTTYDSVSNLGFNPTVNEGIAVRKIETNIFGYESPEGGAYGKNVTVYFDHFSRGERKFRDKEELFALIARDCANALEYRKKR